MRKDIDDPVLGRLKWHEGEDAWFAEVELAPGHLIEVAVEFREDEDDEVTMLGQARRWLARVRQREVEYRAWTAGKLVNGRWNTDEPMTTGDITELLGLLSVVCFPDGTAELFWDDDDRLVYGHGIGTLLGADGECVEIDRHAM